MKKLLTFLSALILLSGCSLETSDSTASLDLSENDFDPPTEVERGSGNDGPYEQRLLTARSEDGVTWTRDNVILSEQANTPDMVSKDGTLFLYYTGGNFDGNEQGMAAALSEDNGKTWTFKRVTLTGAEEIKSIPGDPDIILLEDGTFRLYFTAQKEGAKGPAIFYAEGSDGLNFDYRGEAFSAEGYTAVDSSAFIVNGKWMMLTFNGFGTEVIHAVSEDEGQSFGFVKAENVTYKDKSYFMANPLALEDGSVRFYAFHLGTGSFRSFHSKDGLSWEDDGIVHLSYDPQNDLEGFYLKDPSVVQLANGSYLMVYVTRAPLN